MLSRISRFLLLLLASLSIGQAHAGLDAISNADAGSGVREALAKGAEFAVASLGKDNGFLANDKVKSPFRAICRKWKAACACSAWASRLTSWSTP